MIDIHTVLAKLAHDRPLFHSEADLQHAFAWKLHLAFPAAAIRLEYPVEARPKPIHVDLVANIGEPLLVELKYKTRRIVTVSAAEKFQLRGHGAQPVSRYAFLKDIERLESVALAGAIRWAILVTNDTAYWSGPGKADGIDAAFSLKEGRTCSGVLDWGPGTSAGTKGKNDKPIRLAGQYRFRWREFSDLNQVPFDRFRYLAVEVTARNTRGIDLKLATAPDTKGRRTRRLAG